MSPIALFCVVLLFQTGLALAALLGIFLFLAIIIAHAAVGAFMICAGCKAFQHVNQLQPIKVLSWAAFAYVVSGIYLYSLGLTVAGLWEMLVPDIDLRDIIVALCKVEGMQCI